MKKLLVSFIALFVLISGFSQDNDNYWEALYTSPYDYSTLVDSFYIYVNSTYPDSIPYDKLKNIKEFHRFVYFWNGRMGIMNDSLSYLPYSIAAKENSHTPYCSSADPAQWELKGPETLEHVWLGLVAEVLYDPNNPDNYILSSDHGGIWRYQSSVNKWVNTTDVLRYPGLSATEIIRNPFNNQHLFASTGGGNGAAGYQYGAGIIESINNGESWDYVESFPEGYSQVSRIIYDPHDNNPLDGLNLYAITYNDVYVSTNTGLSWTKLNQPPIYDHNTQLCDIEINDAGSIFVTTHHPWIKTAGQILIYEGDDWYDISDDFGEFQKALISTPHEDKIFLLTDLPEINNNNALRTIYKSTDDGVNWNPIVTRDRIGFALLEYSHESDIVYFGQVDFYYFKNEIPYDVVDVYTGHPDQRDIDFMGVEDDSETILIGNDGGIVKLTVEIENLSSEYDNLNGDFLPIGNFVGMGVTDIESEFIIGGTVHCNSFKLENNQWTRFGYGDGGDSEINWLDPEYYYFTQNGTMTKYDGFNITDIYSNQNDWFIGMDCNLNPNDPYLVYFGRREYTDSNNDEIPARLFIYNELINDLSVKEVDHEFCKSVGAIGINSNNTLFIADHDWGDGSKDGRLLKSLDNGENWIDMSDKPVNHTGGQEPLKALIVYTSIKEILFNPDNPNELWITIGGVNTDENHNPDPGKLRVLHSTDLGENWDDYSEGLSALPVMALEYHLGSDGRIFAGTDVGVFYRDPTMEQWECFSNGLPVSIITDLDYEPCSNYLYASTYSRAIFKTPVLFSEYTPMIISSGENIIWDEDKNVFSDLIIQNNATLTISSNVYFPEEKKIIVERGGHLIIDGGVLSNYCGLSWDGIELHGNSLEPQNSGNQGIVSIINEGTIKNAVCGIKAIKPDSPTESDDLNYAYTGGIILANKANFFNNHIAVDMYSYQFESMSSFTKCTFETNNDVVAEEW